MKTVIDSPRAETYGATSNAFSIKQDHKAFRAFSDGLYSNKPEAIVRELSSNAVDAHIEAGNRNTPFEIFLPCDDNPRFIIRDYGTGLSPEQIEKIYTVYGESTKDKSNEQIGGFGLGSKTPFAYSDQFFVRSYYEGKIYTYNFYFSEDCPNWALISVDNTDAPNGMEIYFDVDDMDFNDFFRAAKRVLPWFGVPVNIYSSSVEENGFFHTDGYTEDLSSKFKKEHEDKIMFQDDSLMLRLPKNHYSGGNTSVLQGGVHYALGGNGLDDVFREGICRDIMRAWTNTKFCAVMPDGTELRSSSANIIVKCEIGTLELARSRENVSWTRNHSIPNARKLYQNLMATGLDKILDQLESAKSAYQMYKILFQALQDAEAKEAYDALGAITLQKFFRYLKHYDTTMSTDDKKDFDKFRDALGKARLDRIDLILKNTGQGTGVDFRGWATNSLANHFIVPHFDVETIKPPKKTWEKDWVTNVRYYESKASMTYGLMSNRLDCNITYSNTNANGDPDRHIKLHPFARDRGIILIIHNTRQVNQRIFNELFVNGTGQPSIQVDCRVRTPDKVIKKDIIPYVLKKCGLVKDDIRIIITGELDEATLKKSENYTGKKAAVAGRTCIYDVVFPDGNLEHTQGKYKTAEDRIADWPRRYISRQITCLRSSWHNFNGAVTTDRKYQLDELVDRDVVYTIKDEERCRLPDFPYYGADRSVMLHRLIIAAFATSKNPRKEFANTRFVVIGKNDVKKVTEVARTMTSGSFYLQRLEQALDDPKMFHPFMRKLLVHGKVVRTFKDKLSAVHEERNTLTFSNASNSNVFTGSRGLVTLRTLYGQWVTSPENSYENANNGIKNSLSEIHKKYTGYTESRIIDAVFRENGVTTRKTLDYDTLLNTRGIRYLFDTLQPFKTVTGTERTMYSLRDLPDSYITEKEKGLLDSIDTELNDIYEKSLSESKKCIEVIRSHPGLLSIDYHSLEKNLNETGLDNLDNYLLKLAKSEQAINQQNVQEDTTT